MKRLKHLQRIFVRPFPRLRECCRQVEPERVSNSRKKIHQTWERPCGDSLYIYNRRCEIVLASWSHELLRLMENIVHSQTTMSNIRYGHHHKREILQSFCTWLLSSLLSLFMTEWPSSFWRQRQSNGQETAAPPVMTKAADTSHHYHSHPRFFYKH